MKKILLYAAATAAMTACTISEIENITPEVDNARVITITATSDNGTRAAVQDDWSVAWEEGDAMLAINSNALSKFTLTDGAGSKNGSFEGTVSSEDEFSLV